MVTSGEALSSWCAVLGCTLQSLCDITSNIRTPHSGATAIIQYAYLKVSIPKSMEQSTSWEANLQLFKTFSLFTGAEGSLPSLPQPAVESVLSGMSTVHNLLSYFSFGSFWHSTLTRSYNLPYPRFLSGFPTNIVLLIVYSSNGRYMPHDPPLFNPLNPELNPICYLLVLLGAHHFPYLSRIRVKLLTFRLLMSYIYGAPILDVSRSHTTTQHSR